ncbi:DUF2513 domain-containing protein [Pseudomonas monteilii]|uniref:DUF2513 domain-containing protein n=1 Tax=Pseudomonas monteilii TaxID=76759 RepID=UPI003D9637C1
MERNEELAVTLLSYIEAEDHEGVGLYRKELRNLHENTLVGADVDSTQVLLQVDYHLHLLETAGFVTREAEGEKGRDELDIFELTWAGHDFLAKNTPLDFSGDFVTG